MRHSHQIKHLGRTMSKLYRTLSFQIGMLARTSVLLGTVCTFAQETLPARNDDTGKDEAQIVNAKIRSRAIEKNIIGDSSDRDLLVYLPPSYETSTDTRYPVVYLLHGNDPRGCEMWDSRWVSIKSIMDKLIANGSVQDMIVAMPHAYSKYGSGQYANSSVTGHWEDFITREVIDHVDRNYRTLTSPDSRGLCGFSMGGRGALYLAMKYPNLYGAVYGLSSGQMGFEHFTPSFHRMSAWQKVLAHHNTKGIPRLIGFAAAFSPNPKKSPFFVDLPYEIVDGRLQRDDEVWKRWLAHDPLFLLKTHASNLKRLRGIKFDCGKSDQLLAANHAFSAALNEHQVNHSFEEFEGNHTDKLPSRIESKALPFFSQVLAFQQSNADGSPIASEENEQRVAEGDGTKVWPQFRGPGGSGIARDSSGLPVHFGPDENVVWKTPIPSGVSSPCIWGDRIFLTSFDNDDRKLETLCIDRKTGEILWRRDIPVKRIEKVHRVNSPAASTPTTDGKHLYVYAGSYGLTCYDIEGNQIWDKTLPLAKNYYGTASSPILAGNLLVVAVQGEKSYLLAADARNGATVWKVDRPEFHSGWGHASALAT